MRSIITILAVLFVGTAHAQKVSSVVVNLPEESEHNIEGTLELTSGFFGRTFQTIQLNALKKGSNSIKVTKSEKVKDVDVSFVFASRSGLKVKVIGTMTPEKNTFETEKIYFGTERFDVKLECSNVIRSRVVSSTLELDFREFKNLSDCQGKDFVYYSPFGAGNRDLVRRDKYLRYIDYNQVAQDLSQIYQSSLQELILPSEDEASKVVQEISLQIAKKSDKKLEPKTYIINSPLEKIYSSPTGEIFIYRGLLEKISSETSLAGIIAREWAHVTAEHSFKELNKKFNNVVDAMGLYILSGKAPESKDEIYSETLPKVISGADKASGYTPFSDSQDFEKEADQYGSQYALLANYHPEGLLEWLKTQKAQDQSKPDFLDKYKAEFVDYDSRITYLNYLIDFFYPSRKDWKMDSEKFDSLKEALKSLPQSDTAKSNAVQKLLEDSLEKGQEKFLLTFSRPYIDELIKVQQKRNAAKAK